MTSNLELAKRFREVILNGTWIANTNFKHQLEHLNYTIATTKFANLNTIAVLAQHIHYYIGGIKKVLEGGPLDIHDKYSFDFPAVQSQTQWEHFLQRFFADAEAFALLIEQMPGQQLKEYFVDEKYGTYERNLEGMIEHSYYHLGQLVMLKKLLESGN